MGFSCLFCCWAAQHSMPLPQSLHLPSHCPEIAAAGWVLGFRTQEPRAGFMSISQGIWRALLQIGWWYFSCKSSPWCLNNGQRGGNAYRRWPVLDAKDTSARLCNIGQSFVKIMLSAALRCLVLLSTWPRCITMSLKPCLPHAFNVRVTAYMKSI